MGDEVSLRTKQAFEAGLANITGRLDQSLESAKEDNDFLNGLPAIEDVTPEILKTIAGHTHKYSPFEVYARAMSAYYHGHQLTVGGPGHMSRF